MKGFAIVLFAVIFVASVQSLTDEQKEKLKKHHQECKVESGVDDAVVTKARKGEFTNDAKLKKHLLCVSKKIGFQNEAGEIQKDVLKAKLGAEVTDAKVVDELVAKCAVQKASPEDTAYDTIECYYKNTPQHISLV